MKKMIAIITVLLAAAAVSAPVRSMLAARASINTPATKAEYTAKDYIQDGLIAMWDGIENAGWGVHDANATVWKDLVSSNNWRLASRSYWKTNSLSKDGSIGYIAFGSWGPINYYTFETCCCPRRGTKTTGRYFFQNQNRGCVVIVSDSYSTIYNLNNQKPRICIDFRNSDMMQVTLSFVVGDYNYYYCQLKNGYANGIERGFTQTNWDWAKTSNTTLGGASESDTDYPWSGDIYNIRIYQRPLTSQEVKHNYRIDKSRFNLP